MQAQQKESNEKHNGQQDLARVHSKLEMIETACGSNAHADAFRLA